MFHQSELSPTQEKLNTNFSAAMAPYSTDLHTRVLSNDLQSRASSSQNLVSNTQAKPSGSTADNNNTISTATAWVPLNGNFAYGESIGGSDTNDYFSFSLNSTSSLSMVMSGLSANADIRLLNANGSQILVSNNSGTHGVAGNAYKVSTSEAFDVTLNTGTYYFQVSSYDGGITDYKMDFLAKPVTYTSDWYSQNLKDSSITHNDDASKSACQ